MEHTSLTSENFNKLDVFIQSHLSETEGLMPILHEAQDIFGYIPLEVQKFISDKTGVSHWDFSFKNSWGRDFLFSIFN